MSGADSTHPTFGLRLVLWSTSIALVVGGVALAIFTQSLLPLVCIGLGLGIPLLPFGRRER